MYISYSFHHNGSAVPTKMSIEPRGGHSELERDVKLMLEWMRAICVSLKLSFRGLEAEVSG